MSKLAALALGLVFIVGCEDGPTQTFSPAPNDAGSQWNDGATPPATACDGTAPTCAQAFTSAYPTTGKTTLCSTDLTRQRWAWMLNQPISPPRLYAGIDMAKNDQWEGLTIEDAEAPPTGKDPSSMTGGLCQSISQGSIGGCASGIGTCNQNYWGNNQEVIFEWNVATHQVDQMILQLGYLGVMKFTSRDGQHTYELGIGVVPKKDNAPFLVDWNGKPAVQITEMFNAAMATFAPAAGIPFDKDSDNCQADGNCLVYNAGGTTIFGFRPLVIYVGGVSGVPQPALSTPTYFYNFYSKFEPYGNLPQVMKLDAEGPLAIGTPNGARDPKMICTQKIGIDFGDFKKQCVQVHGPADQPDTIDTVNLAKIENGLSHDQEHWTANVVGVNQNFTSLDVANSPDTVVLDTDKPQDGDIAQDFFFDLRAKGHVRNDYNDKNRLDLRGTALVYVEWARLMLNDINAQMKALGLIPQNQPPKVLGDPSCTGITNGQPNFAPGCSGIEGMIVPWWPGVSQDFTQDASCANPQTCLDPGPNWDPLLFYGVSQLRPGDKSAAFCSDPGTFTDCYTSGSPLFSAQQWVQAKLGKGKVASLPSELQDRRYYYKWFGIAFIKYMKAYSNWPMATRDHWPCSTLVNPGCSGGGPGPTDVKNQIIDLESLFFDSVNSANFDKFEYIDRDNIGKGQENTPAAPYNYVPWDFEYGIDLIGGNQRYDNWYRRMDREETAMYASMLTDKVNHTPGQENNVNITNLFGSPVLPAIWPSYPCAIGQAGDPQANCGGVNAPLDPSRITPCGAGCPNGQFCITNKSYENGIVSGCGLPADFVNHPASGCAAADQTAVADLFTAQDGCLPMLMDLNGPGAQTPHPFLYYYPGVWSRTPFALGHSPIALHAADKHPNIGVAKISIPNFKDGPYTPSPMLSPTTTPADPMTMKCAAGLVAAMDPTKCCPAGMASDPTSTQCCPMSWSFDGSGKLCQAPLDSGMAWQAPSFTTLAPWLEMQPGVGFGFPIDAQHDQFVNTAQIDFTGVLESYIVDFTPWLDAAKPSCTNDGKCNAGYTCDPVGKGCVAADDTIHVEAIEANDFLGAAFLCQDLKTGDVLHVRQYDSVIRIVNWLAAHQGGWDPNFGQSDPSAQANCQIIIRYSPNNLYADTITSKANGVKLNIAQGAGLGRVVDIALYDPGIPQTP